MDKIYQNIIKNMPVGYALHKIIFNESGLPANYEIIETNKAFEGMTGLEGEIINKWLKNAMGSVVRDQECKFENYLKIHDKWYRGSVFLYKENHLVLLVDDVTESKRREEANRKNQEEKSRMTIERQKILVDVIFRGFKDRQEQLDYALHESLKMSQSQFGYIYLYEEKTREFTLNSWTNGVMEQCAVTDQQTRYQLDKTGLWGEVVRQRKPIIVNDFQMPNPLKKGFPSGHVALKNFMSIPIIVDDEIVAVAGLGNKEQDYDDNDVYEMKMLMNGVWMAVMQREGHVQIENLLKQTQSMFNEHEAIMLLIDPVEGKIIDANPSALDFYGYEKDELLNMFISDINTFNKSELTESMTLAMERKKKFFTFSHRLKNQEIRKVDVYASPISYNGKKVLFSIIFDVTEREESLNKIKYISCHDHLTGVYNRRYFDEQLKLFDEKTFYPLSIIMADINGLKLVNDSFGTREGDLLLKTAADLIVRGCKEDGIVARIGGDEFAIILPNTDEAAAQGTINSMKKMLGDAKTDRLGLSMSFGFQTKKDQTMEMKNVLAQAENFMYKHKVYERDSAKSKTISIIMNTLFEKSQRELMHSKRVSELSGLIAKAMSFDPEGVNQIITAGLLHDIGKIGIDEKILNKPGKLDSNEWEEIKKHPESGWRILSNSDEFSELAVYILNHHERWDGTGYPEGIKGEAIPIQARIINIADSFDAMTKDRPYRKGMTIEEATGELEKYAGTQFDPTIVKIFVTKVLQNE